MFETAHDTKSREPSNRTILELKLNSISFVTPTFYASNRTILELK